MQCVWLHLCNQPPNKRVHLIDEVLIVCSWSVPVWFRMFYWNHNILSAMYQCYWLCHLTVKPEHMCNPVLLCRQTAILPVFTNCRRVGLGDRSYLCSLENVHVCVFRLIIIVPMEIFTKPVAVGCGSTGMLMLLFYSIFYSWVVLIKHFATTCMSK